MPRRDLARGGKGALPQRGFSSALLSALVAILAILPSAYSETLRVTPEHPFLLNGSWVEAQDLKQGDVLNTLDGQVRVTGIIRVAPATPITVYNLEAGVYHDFVVANQKLIVHNSDLEISGGVCFTGETPVVMADYSKRAISEIQIGDSVLSWDFDTASLQKSSVTGLQRHYVDEIYIINEHIGVTKEHPFWVVGKGWSSIEGVPAIEHPELSKISKLDVGDDLISYGGTLIRVQSIRKVTGTLEVFNLEIGKRHNYFAGDVLVHNQGNPCAQRVPWSDELPDLRPKQLGLKGLPTMTFEDMEANAKRIYGQYGSLKKLAVARNNPTQANIQAVIDAAEAEGIKVNFVSNGRVTSGQIYLDKGLPPYTYAHPDNYGASIGNEIFLEQGIKNDLDAFSRELGHELGYIHTRNFYGRRANIPHTGGYIKIHATHILDSVVVDASKAAAPVDDAIGATLRVTKAIDFSSADSFDELYRMINAYGEPTQGTVTTFTPEKLVNAIRAIEMKWRAGEQIYRDEINYITRANGARSAVKKLISVPSAGGRAYYF